MNAHDTAYMIIRGAQTVSWFGRAFPWLPPNYSWAINWAALWSTYWVFLDTMVNRYPGSGNPENWCSELQIFKKSGKHLTSPSFLIVCWRWDSCRARGAQQTIKQQMLLEGENSRRLSICNLLMRSPSSRRAIILSMLSLLSASPPLPCPPPNTALPSILACLDSRDHFLKEISLNFRSASITPLYEIPCTQFASLMLWTRTDFYLINKVFGTSEYEKQSLKEFSLKAPFCKMAASDWLSGGGTAQERRLRTRASLSNAAQLRMRTWRERGEVHQRRFDTFTWKWATISLPAAERKNRKRKTIDFWALKISFLTMSGTKEQRRRRDGKKEIAFL